MKVQSTFYIDFISKTVDVLLISSFITKQMPKLLIFDAFTLLICKKNVAIYVLLRCQIFSLKSWLCKIFDKFHVCYCICWEFLSNGQHECCKDHSCKECIFKDHICGVVIIFAFPLPRSCVGVLTRMACRPLGARAFR